MSQFKEERKYRASIQVGSIYASYFIGLEFKSHPGECPDLLFFLLGPMMQNLE
jgi:hypothetical protein